MGFNSAFRGLNAELNPICHMLEFLGAHHIFHVGGIRVNVSRGSSQSLQLSSAIIGEICHSYTYTIIPEPNAVEKQ